MSLRRAGQFTIDRLDRDPWIETVTELGLSDEELAEIYTQAPNAKGSPYFATLALDLPALVQRTGLFNNTMRSPGGASNAERELAATAVSRVNGCVYCASVHARIFANLSKQRELTQRFLDDGIDLRIRNTERSHPVTMETGNVRESLERCHPQPDRLSLDPGNSAGLLRLQELIEAALRIGQGLRSLLP
jgi:AhpD family alkylhydroperoxidase